MELDASLSWLALALTPWAGFPFVWTIAGGVWVAGGGVSGAFAAVGAVQVAGRGGAGGIQEAGV